LAGLTVLTGQAYPFPDRQEPDSTLIAVVTRALESPDLQAMAMGLIDTIGGRLSGTPAGTRSEAWAAQWLRRLGMDSVWFEPVRIPVWRRGAASLRVVAPALLRQRRISAAAYGYTPGLTADSVPVIDIGRGNPVTVDSISTDLEGAALLTDGVVGAELIAKAVERGAAALLRISFEPGRLPQARVAPTAEPPAPLAILSLPREDGLWLRRQVAAGPLSLAIRVEAETQPGTSLNVVGEWRGSDAAVRDEIFLLGAHLDSWDLGDGAIDNGTGVLTVLSAVQALSSGAVRPRRTVRVVLFAAEELGLLGSRRYVQAHGDEMSRLVAMMNLDMVGRPEAYGATGHSEADSLFARLAGMLEGLGLEAQVNHGGGPGSDHQPFLLAGVPTIYVQTSLPPDAPLWYHNAGDTLDKVDLDALRASAAAVAAAVWSLADHPGRPLRHLSAQETRVLVQRLGW
ncbi:MAG: M20/M25/M40 family metallo-hydrolase, partial [Gemmatimonadales bacterium]